MTKLRNTLGLAIALAAASTLLAGCELYFGSHDQDDTWNYCGSDGYYNCYGDECTWVAPTCPAGGGNNSGSGYQCESSTDCAAGCYCQDGVCEEAGFCSTDADCGDGYHCNTDRASCEPDETPTGCTSDAGCPTGTTCNVDTGLC
nr:hypothetical protein [Deltaproteobacteria bacterium]